MGFLLGLLLGLRVSELSLKWIGPSLSAGPLARGLASVRDLPVCTPLAAIGTATGLDDVESVTIEAKQVGCRSRPRMCAKRAEARQNC